MGKRRGSKRKGKGPKRQERRPARTSSASPFRRNALIGGMVVAVALVTAAILVAVNRRSEETHADTGMAYDNIQGGFTEEGFPYLGSLEADVVLTEFTDFNCSHCQTYNLETEDSILRDYVATGKVRYVLHYYSNGSSQSLQVTDAAMCAADEGLYFQFQRAFFENPVVTREGLIAIARELGMDEGDFVACWDAGRYRSALVEHIKTARALGITGTPSFMINDQLVVGNRPDLVRQTIEDELAAAD
jgi:protein-disulfide isomerase